MRPRIAPTHCFKPARGAPATLSVAVGTAGGDSDSERSSCRKEPARVRHGLLASGLGTWRAIDNHCGDAIRAFVAGRPRLVET